MACCGSCEEKGKDKDTCCERPKIWVSGWNGRECLSLNCPEDRTIICATLLALNKGLCVQTPHPVIKVSLKDLVGEHFECGDKEICKGTILNPDCPESVYGLIRKVSSCNIKKKKMHHHHHEQTPCHDHDQCHNHSCHSCKSKDCWSW